MKFKSKSALGTLIMVFAVSGLIASSALAAGAPIVLTKPASPIGGTEAMLNGGVNPNGVTTKYYFEYGTTISYGSKTAESSLAPFNKELSDRPKTLVGRVM